MQKLISLLMVTGMLFAGLAALPMVEQAHAAQPTAPQSVLSMTAQIRAAELGQAVEALGSDGDKAYMFLHGTTPYTPPAESLDTLMVVTTPFTTPATMLQQVINEGHVYQAQGSEGLRIFDLSNPTEFVAYDLPNLTPFDVVVYNERAYLANGVYGLSVLDVAAPLSPEPITETLVPLALTYRVALSGAMLYAASYDGGSHQLHSFDLSDPDAPLAVSQTEVPHWVWQIVPVGQYLYLLDDAAELHVLDVSDPTLPELAHTVYLGYRAYQLVLNDPATPTHGYLLADGVRALDLSNISRPFVTGQPYQGSSARTLGISKIVMAQEDIYALQDGNVSQLQPSAPEIESPPPPKSTEPVYSALPPDELAMALEQGRDMAVRERIWPDIEPLFDDLSLEDDVIVELIDLTEYRNTPDVMLKLTFTNEAHYRFYTETAEGWRLNGFANQWSKFGGFDHRFETIDDQTWLVIPNTSSGTAYYNVEEQWVWLNGDNNIQTVLSYTAGGWQQGLDVFTLEYGAEVVPLDDILPTVQLDYNLTYGHYLENLPPLSITQQVALNYVMPPDSPQFELDALAATDPVPQFNYYESVSNVFSLLLPPILTNEKYRRWMSIYLEEIEYARATHAGRMLWQLINSNQWLEHVEELVPTESKVLFAETFTDTATDWPLADYTSDEGTHYKSTVAEGQYQLTVEGKGYFEQRLPTVQFADFAATIEATPTDDMAGYSYGLVVRGSAASGYNFQIDNEGDYAIYVYDNGWELLHNWSPTPAINQGKMNSLTVIAKEKILSFWVNDHLLLTVEDETVSSGEIGVFVESYSEITATTVAFDNLLITSP